jgi:hypothetical protein
MRAIACPSTLSSLCLLTAAALLTACPAAEPKGDPTEKVEKPKEPEQPKGTEGPKEPDLRPEAKALDLSGPKPPETNVALFAVDGALIPIACFDKDKKSFSGGPKCSGMAPKGEQVYLSSEFGKELDSIGDPKNALCEVASKPTSVSTPVLDGGKAYDWGVWPKSAAPNVQPIPSETTSETGSKLSDPEIEAVKALVGKLKSSATKGDFRPVQRAEVDIDGDGTKELFIGVLFADPKDDSNNLYSGLFMARGGDLAKLSKIDSSNRGSDSLTLRGVTDLDGDGKSELWVGLTFDGGTADRVMVLDGDQAEALSKWSCGA